MLTSDVAVWLSQIFSLVAYVAGVKKSIFFALILLPVTFDLETWSPLVKVALVHWLQSPVEFFKLSLVYHFFPDFFADPYVFWRPFWIFQNFGNFP